MIKEFLNYEQSLELKELGFDEPCFGYYEPNKNLNYIERHILKDFPYLAKNSEWQDLCAAPTFSQAFRFFREKYKLIALIDIGVHEFSYKIFKNERSITHLKDYLDYNGTYEETEVACLNKLIELVKSK